MKHYFNNWIASAYGLAMTTDRPNANTTRFVSTTTQSSFAATPSFSTTAPLSFAGTQASFSSTQASSTTKPSPPIATQRFSNDPHASLSGHTRILVLNCGSSSIKFSVIEPKTQDTHLDGLIECIGQPNTILHWQCNTIPNTLTTTATTPPTRHQENLGPCDYTAAMAKLIPILNQMLTPPVHLTAIGHRVVHGGEQFKTSVLITEDVKAAIRACIPLAPLHNPANLLGIDVATQAFPDLPQVAVFDTAFHQTMPDTAFLYALPYDLYTTHHVRRYGFHGISHHYVSEKATHDLATAFGEPPQTIISCHLGNGCSVCAIKDGRSVDTSMGLTPLEGLMMGTRCGDIDPSLPAYLTQALDCDLDHVMTLLNKESGLLGVSGLSLDMRDLHRAKAQGHRRAALAIDLFCYRLAKTIAAMHVPLGQVDALIFTGGIGENDRVVRATVLEHLQTLGYSLDAEQNQQHGVQQQGIITTSDSQTRALVIKTDEAARIAQDTYLLTCNDQ